MVRNKYSKYFEIGLLTILILLSLWIISPYFIALISGLLLAYVFKPLHLYLTKTTKKKRLSSFLTVLVFILIIGLPFLFILNSLIGEANQAYSLAKDYLNSKQLDIQKISLKFQETFGVYINLEEAAKDFTSLIIRYSQNFLTSLPTKILNIFVSLFVMYYSLIKWSFIKKKIEKVIPLSKKTMNKFMLQFKKVTYGVIYSQLIIAAIQGILGGLSFWIFGINNPVLWGLIMAFLALLPIIGTAFVWGPAVLYLLIIGLGTSTGWLIWKAIGLLAFSVFITSSIDNILRPLMVQAKTKIHPVMVLLGVVGGLSVFGLIGIVLGPLIIATFLTSIEVFAKDFQI